MANGCTHSVFIRGHSRSQPSPPAHTAHQTRRRAADGRFAAFVTVSGGSGPRRRAARHWAADCSRLLTASPTQEQVKLGREVDRRRRDIQMNCLFGLLVISEGLPKLQRGSIDATSQRPASPLHVPIQPSADIVRVCVCVCGGACQSWVGNLALKLVTMSRC